jgi:hypothetical protein
VTRVGPRMSARTCMTDSIVGLRCKMTEKVGVDRGKVAGNAWVLSGREGVALGAIGA